MPLHNNRNFSDHAAPVNQERPEQGQFVGMEGSFGGATILRLPIWPAVTADKKQRVGVIDGFVKTCERWGLNKPQQIALLGYAGNELAAEHVLAGRIRASQDVLDRTGYVLGISIGLRALFNNSIDGEVSWLKAPNTNIDHLSPLEFVLKGRMVNLIAVFNLVAHERAL
jgi:hypothetical protein